MRLHGWIGAIMAAAALAASWGLPDAAQMLAPLKGGAIEQPVVVKPESRAVVVTAREVKSVEPSSVKIEAGGAAVTIVLKGTGLDKLTEAEVFQGTRIAKEIEAKLGTPAPERQVVLKAAAQTVIGTYQLRVGDGTKKIEIPASLVRIEVKPKSAPVAVKPAIAVIKEPLPVKAPLAPKEPIAAVPPKVELPKAPAVMLPPQDKAPTGPVDKPADAAAVKRKLPPLAVKGEVQKTPPAGLPQDKGPLDQKKITGAAPKLPLRDALAKVPPSPGERLPDGTSKISPQTLVSKLPDAKTREPLAAVAGVRGPSAPAVALQKGFLPDLQPRITGFEPSSVTVAPCGMTTVRVTGQVLDKITAARVVLRTPASSGAQSPVLTAALKPPPDDAHLALYVDISADCSTANSRTISPSYYALELLAGGSRVGEELRINVPGAAASQPAVAPVTARPMPMPVRPAEVIRPVEAPRPVAAAKGDKQPPDIPEKKTTGREAAPPPVFSKVEPASLELDTCTSAAVRVSGLNLGRITSARVVAAEGDARTASTGAEGFTTSIQRPANSGDVLFARISTDCVAKTAGDERGGRPLPRKSYRLEFYSDEGRVGDQVPVSLRHDIKVTKADPVPLQLSPCDTGIVHITGSNLADITDVKVTKLSFPDEIVTTLSPGNEARDLRVQVSCGSRGGGMGNYLMQLYSRDSVVKDLPLTIVTPPCPDGKFSALGRFRDCACPAGFRVAIDNEGMAQCGPDTAAGYCPVGDWFCTGSGPGCEPSDCRCPSGYRAENRGANRRCAGSRCPEEKWFGTSAQWRGCACPEGRGLNKRYRNLNSEAICTVADIENEGASDAPDETVGPDLYRIYQGFFAIVGGGATMRQLPPYVQKALRPHFRAGTVELAQYGSSHYVLNGAAMADCMNIFFPSGQGVADDIAGGKILASQNLHVLLHELAHVEQCIAANRGDRSAYARAWFKGLPETMLADVGEAVRRVDLGRVSCADLHARMPMEADADGKADSVAAKLSRP